MGGVSLWGELAYGRSWLMGEVSLWGELAYGGS